MSPAVPKAAALFVAALALELGLLAALGQTSSTPLAYFELGLLLGATTLLGVVWGLREHLRGRADAPAIAALVPAIATALFLSAKLARGGAPDAVLAVAVSLAAAVPIERLFTGWLASAPPTALALALRVVAPVWASVLAALALAPRVSVAPAAAGAAIAGLLVGAWLIFGTRRVEREARALIARLPALDEAPRAPALAPGPRPSDPALAALEQTLRERLAELSAELEAARRAHVEIDEVRQLRSRFMASMSHDLKSPLSSIVGFAQLLEEGLDGELSEAQRQNVVLVRRAAEELLVLLTDTLDLARLEAGRLSLDRRWVPSVELLTEAMRRGRALAAGRDVEIEAELQPGLPPVFVDAPRIVQAVVALFRHAAGSMRPRTTLRLRARAALGPPGPERQLRLELYDAVGALPTEEVERIFEAFREIDAPAGRRLGGLGMALSLARSLVRLHGGEAWADSAPGAGTVLSVALPLEGPEVATTLDATGARP